MKATNPNANVPQAYPHGRWTDSGTREHGPYQPKTGQPCHCRPGVWRDNCPDCEGTGWQIDFAAIRAKSLSRIEGKEKP